jgi:hypothetical protein
MNAFRLVLNEAQTSALADNARFAVCIVHPGSWPTNPGRMLLDLIETDSATANAVLAVLKKSAKKNAEPTSPPTNT